MGDWLFRNSIQSGIDKADDIINSNVSNRTPHDKSKEEKEFLKTELFDKLPKLSSHYYRKSTSKFYLEQRVRSLAELHSEYLRMCPESGRKRVGLTTFKQQFHLSNLALHQP